MTSYASPRRRYDVALAAYHDAHEKRSLIRLKAYSAEMALRRAQNELAEIEAAFEAATHELAAARDERNELFDEDHPDLYPTQH